MSKCKITITQNPGKVTIEFNGSFNETVELPRELPNTPTITLNFKNLMYFNSVGVSQWLNWCKYLEQKHPNTTIEMEECPTILVNQMNTVNEFMPRNCIVKSVYLTFMDDIGDQTEQVLIKAGEHYSSDGSTLTLPVVRAADGTELEPDAEPRQYFKFLKLSGKSAA